MRKKVDELRAQVASSGNPADEEEIGDKEPKATLVAALAQRYVAAQKKQEELLATEWELSRKTFLQSVLDQEKASISWGDLEFSDVSEDQACTYVVDNGWVNSGVLCDTGFERMRKRFWTAQAMATALQTSLATISDTGLQWIFVKENNDEEKAARGAYTKLVFVRSSVGVCVCVCVGVCVCVCVGVLAVCV